MYQVDELQSLGQQICTGHRLCRPRAGLLQTRQNNVQRSYAWDESSFPENWRRYLYTSKFSPEGFNIVVAWLCPLYSFPAVPKISYITLVKIFLLAEDLQWLSLMQAVYERLIQTYQKGIYSVNLKGLYVVYNLA